MLLACEQARMVPQSAQSEKAIVIGRLLAA
jgi:hypothetical protein